MKTMSLILFSLLLSGCVIPQSGGPTVRQGLREGMTMAEVHQSWGPPAHYSSFRLGTGDYATWTYRQSDKVVMPGFGGARPYSYRIDDFYTVQFRNGVVIGGAR